MPTHSLCSAFPFASRPSMVTRVRKKNAPSYLTVSFRPIPRPRCDFLAFSFHVPSNALPKQSDPAASHTARDTKLVLDVIGADEAGIWTNRQCFCWPAPKSQPSVL